MRIEGDTVCLISEQPLNAPCRAGAIRRRKQLTDTQHRHTAPTHGPDTGQTRDKPSLTDRQGARFELKMIFIKVLVLLATGLTVKSGKFHVSDAFLRVEPKAKVKRL